MATFTLTSGGNSFNFDLAGNVTTTAGQAAGTWKTNRSNQIVLTKGDRSTVNFDVGWAFNAKNQLTVGPAGGAVFNFGTVAGLRNNFQTVNTVLQVKPDQLNSFTFKLHGTWGMDANHDLTLTVNGTSSSLNGFVSDPLGRFIYHFADGDNALQTYVLGFVGTWQSKTDANGTPLIEFHYQKEPNPDGTAGGEGIFSLPNAVAIQRTTNQLSYTYSKANKTLSINFQGTLMIDPDFQLTYVVQRQVSSGGQQMVGSTTIGFGAMITKPNLQGDLDLTVTKPDGSAGNTTLTIGGSFTGVLGKANLQVGFSFSQTFGPGNQISRTAAFNGDLTFPAGSVQWTFSATGTTIDLAVGTDIKFGAVDVDTRLNAQFAAGQVVGITFFLGVSF
jgi:hypothetical protein